MVQISTSAFISSCYKSESLIELCSPLLLRGIDNTDLIQAETIWKSYGLPEEEWPKENDTKIQTKWDFPVCKLALHNLIDAANDETDMARLKAISQEHSSDWLEALPCSNLGLKIDNKQFRIACGLRLGAKICLSHTCVCGDQVKNDGTHGLSCKRSAGRLPRHSHVNDLIKRALVSGGIASVKEPQGLSRSDGKRPDGMSIYPWKQGKLLLWDFTCSDTLNKSYVSNSSKQPG